MVIDMDTAMFSRYRLLLIQEIEKEVQACRAAKTSIFGAIEVFDEEKNIVYEILLRSAAEKGWNEISLEDAISLVDTAIRYDLTYENYSKRINTRDRVCLYLFGNAVDNTVDIYRNEERRPMLRLKEGAVDAYLGKCQ